MKTRFNNYDIVCTVAELQKLVGLRVYQIYDIDNKSYLIRLQQSDTKCVLLMESGIRFHTTTFDWPKNVAPSAFSMKLRKHLKNKRLEKLEQIGSDRIVDFQFGSGDAACHIILELYDRGNIILTDHELTILNILRPHVEGEDIRFSVREKYPMGRAKKHLTVDEEYIKRILSEAKPGEQIRRLLMPVLDCGPAVIEHAFLKHGLNNVKIPGQEVIEEPEKKVNKRKNKKDDTTAREFNMETDLPVLVSTIAEVDEMLLTANKTNSKGYIIQKKETKLSTDLNTEEFFFHNIEYHPYLFEQYKNQPYKEFESFVEAVDEFYSMAEGQKIDMKVLQQEQDALKKLSNVKLDHSKRLEELTKVQAIDNQKAELISRNQQLVDSAILAIRSSLANQMSWPNIQELVKAAQARGDIVAQSIKQLKLETNNIALSLDDPYIYGEEDDKLPSQVIDVDLSLSAYANARAYYDHRRFAAKKEIRTINASEKALKSAEKKTQQSLKELRTISSISKARKVYWFEKFYWFISSENYLVIGGRDAQQNELIVKRYMRNTDIYVHAEIQGASSVVIKNPLGGEVPPKTLLEAGTMAISYSVAWDAKVVTNAYWVKSEQVSKTAPSGEYLGTGSFMIRGKKNFLPPCHLIMGLSFLFKLEESSIERHKGERKVRSIDDEKDLLLGNNKVGNSRFEEGEIEIELEEESKLEKIEEKEELNLENNQNLHIVEEEEENDERKNEKPDDEDQQSNEEHELDAERNDDKDDSDEERQYPDTHIKIEHSTGKNSILSPLEVDVIQKSSKMNIVPEEENGSYIITSMPNRKKQQTSSKKKKEAKRVAIEKAEQISAKNISEKTSSAKRGQRGKLKKIKEKYKDQDDEERKMRMEILKSDGNKKDAIEEKDDTVTNAKPTGRKIPNPKMQQDDDTLDDAPAGAEVDMLDSLTGCPMEEDEILFAIPVVAPYQSLQNFKYRVKLTPGPGKRGKAAKTALLLFSKDKSCTPREKDLLKEVKEESLARNVPGKVKLSAPQLQKYKN